MGSAQSDAPEPIDKYDRYPPYDPESSMSRCPWCGEEITPRETVVTVDGRVGMDVALTTIGQHVRTFHHDCRRKRQILRRRVENTFITEYMD